MTTLTINSSSRINNGMTTRGKTVKRALIWPILMTLASCGAQQDVAYPLSTEVARERLKKVEVPMFVFGTEATMEPSPTAVITAPERLQWSVKVNGAELLRYAATIKPIAADQTRVDVTLIPASPQIAERLAANPDVRDLYQAAMVEAVDAGLEERPFSDFAIRPATVVLVANRIGDIGAEMDRRIEKDRRDAKSNIERAYAAEGVEY